MNGYVLSKWRFRGSDSLFTLILFGMFIPYQSILIPLVQVLSRVGLYGSITGLIFVHVVYGIPITTLIFRNYYATVPGELIEAGKIDGAGLLGIYRSIIFPISMPAFAGGVILPFTSIWDDFLFRGIVTPPPAGPPVTVGLHKPSGRFLVGW